MACLLAAMLFSSKRIMNAIPGWLKGAALGIVCAGLVLFFTVEGLILSQYNASAAPGADYCIILGAKLAKAEEPQDREKAKNSLKNAIIGFVLIFVLIVVLKLGMTAMQSWMKSNIGGTGAAGSWITGLRL